MDLSELPSSRKEAVNLGIDHYQNKKPCKYGHSAPRHVSSGICPECDRIRNLRKYHCQTEEQRTKHLMNQRARHAKDPEKAASKRREYTAKNIEKIRSKRRENYRNCPDKIIERARAFYEKNKERIRKRKKEYHNQNLARHNAHNAQRRARKLQATPKWLTKEQLQQIEAIYEQAAYLTKTSGEQHHVDHIIPLQGKTVCGLHVPHNLQILTADENIRKGNRLLH